jgi:transposase InsO family protein
MRYDQAEKMEIIRTVEGSELSVKRTLAELDVPRSTYYRWYQAFLEDGYEGLADRRPKVRRFWNRIPDQERQRVVETALERPELTPRELAWHITDHEGYFISESSVYRILKSFDLVTSPAHIVMAAADEFRHKTRRVHELWQTDFTYFKIIGWGWYYLSTVMDDYSRYILAWRLCSGMSTDDVTTTLDMAIAESGVDHVYVRHRPRLLSDNGPCYISGELKQYLSDQGLTHTRGKPYHPMTQGKIERYHRTMKNVLLLDNYYCPDDLKAHIEAFVEHYNYERYHESLDNVTPADVYCGRAAKINTERQRIKERTMKLRKKNYRKAIAKAQTVS